MIRVTYTCKLCGTIERVLEVRHRNFGELVTSWMDDVVIAVAGDHARISPMCVAKKLDALKIPYSEDREIGAPEVN